MSDIVWQQTLDNGEYAAAVLRDDNEAYRGWLIVSDVTGEILHKEKVSLAYAARFGPDIDDVQVWMERTIAVVDNPKFRRPDEGPHPEDEQ
jgi:hypothetical protein